MLQYSFQLKELANEIELAVERTIDAGVVTPDLKGNSATNQVTRRIIEEYKQA